MPSLVVSERCPYCSKFRSPRDIMPMPGGATICLDCEQRHIDALAALASGNFMSECSECGKTPEQLRSPNGQMAVHFENGRYKAMCLPCDATYVRLRADLYADTEFGWKSGLK